MLTLLLTRHGHTDRSEPEQYLGQRIDAELSKRGRADARKLARRLASVEIQRVLSSPLKRAHATADILARSRDVATELEPRLAELDYGAWEGHTREEIDALFPGGYEKYDRDPAHFEVGGGESGTEVAARLWPVVDGLIEWAEKRGGQRGGESTALVVGHSSTNRILLAMLLGVELNDYRRRFDQDWTNLTVLRWPSRAEGPRLLLSNDQSHTRGVRGVTWG